VIFVQTIAETCWKLLLIAGTALGGGGGGGGDIDVTHVRMKMVLMISV
jgi:hypothetical protein